MKLTWLDLNGRCYYAAFLDNGIKHLGVIRVVAAAKGGPPFVVSYELRATSSASVARGSKRTSGLENPSTSCF